MSNQEIDKFGTKIWHNDKGELHRKDGPAIERTNGDKLWFLHGKLHRDHGPALEDAGGYKGYWINGYRYDSLEEGLMNQALD